MDNPELIEGKFYWINASGSSWEPARWDGYPWGWQFIGCEYEWTKPAKWLDMPQGPDNGGR